MRKLVLFSDCVCVSVCLSVACKSQSSRVAAAAATQGLEADLQPFIQTFKRFRDAFLEELNKFNTAKFQTVQTLEGIVDSRAAAAEQKKLFSTSSAGGSAAAVDCWAGHKVVGFCALEHQPEEDDDGQNVVYFEKDYCGDLRPENGVCWGLRTSSEATPIQMKAKW